MKKIHALIIDDEISAVNTLRGMIGEFCPSVKVIATARTIEEAVAAAAQHLPDLVFLDIEMPPFGNGFDFLNRTRKQHGFGVIFTTAYPKYAVQAIKATQPWGYLIKPFSVTELLEAIKVASDKLRDSDSQGIVIPDSRKGNQVLRVREILYCKADGATTDIFMLRHNRLEKITASRTLKDLETELPESYFCRTHHSFMVNMQHIERYERTGRNGRIYLPQNASVGISVLKMDYFEKRFAAFLER